MNQQVLISKNQNMRIINFFIMILIMGSLSFCTNASINTKDVREHITFNENWKFFKYESIESSDSLIYDVRPEINKYVDSKPADSKPTKAEQLSSDHLILKPWILSTGNDFIKNVEKHYQRPEGNPGSDFPFVQKDFDDSSWENINLPHDWAIKGPFYEGDNPEVGGGMGRLPSHGVAWYRKKFEVPASDSNRVIYLDIDGAMSYTMVWLNGYLVGGWPYGYNSWRVDLTQYLKIGQDNQISIRLDNPNHSARWYPGGGIYRNVWLVKTNKVHVAQWGTFIKTKNVSSKSAEIDLEVTIENKSNENADIAAVTNIYELDKEDKQLDKIVVEFDKVNTSVKIGNKIKINQSVKIDNPKLWGPIPEQVPNRYVAVTKVYQNENMVDVYETKFGIRSLRFDPNTGIYVNDQHIKIKGVNQHHDLGALGAAFNTRAAERQIEILQEMGCNAVRTAHNPPAPELLDLFDKMGILVMDEVFDCWERKKTPHDFHLIFPDWYEQDLRSMVRRDKNHPSIIMWSFGNEVGEQYTDTAGARIAATLREITKDEDPTRLTTSAMNWAKSFMPLPKELDVISFNYQGEGIRQDPIFEGTDRIRTVPQYNIYHKTFPDKVILSSETATAASSRGIYLFPVTKKLSSPIIEGMGGDSMIAHVSSYELYAVDFGSSVDKVFGNLEKHSFSAGEFVWNGFDYIGEPTPYYSARSSYTGIIDLAGFKKDRYYLYQSHWRPGFPMVHILPHWNWPDRLGEITPIHVFTSGDEAELFINGKSLGRKKKREYEYRLRWDDVKYEPGKVKVIAYKDGKKWAEDIVKTTDEPVKIELSIDRSEISADGYDLSFVTAIVKDKNGLEIPDATNLIKFTIEGNGEIVATDNGDQTDFTPFLFHQRKLFSGKVLAIVRSIKDKSGIITLTANSDGLEEAAIKIKSIK